MVWCVHFIVRDWWKTSLNVFSLENCLCVQPCKFTGIFTCSKIQCPAEKLQLWLCHCGCSELPIMWQFILLMNTVTGASSGGKCLNQLIVLPINNNQVKLNRLLLGFCYLCFVPAWCNQAAGLLWCQIWTYWYLFFVQFTSDGHYKNLHVSFRFHNCFVENQNQFFLFKKNLLLNSMWLCKIIAGGIVAPVDTPGNWPVKMNWFINLRILFLCCAKHWVKKCCSVV